MSTFCILLSCMNETEEIIKRSNIKSNCVIVNQCNIETKKLLNLNDSKKCCWINSKERGLSKSRNMAIKNSNDSICLLADDDEFFDENCEEKILKAYKEVPKADILVFNLYDKKTKLKGKVYKLNKLELLKVCSLQISFKRDAIISRDIKFDVKLGAGTGNGAGEENKFLLDAYEKGLRIYHYPINIARMIENGSTWFRGFNEEYFYKRGASTRYILGFWLSCLYALYFLAFKYDMYSKQTNFISALKNIMHGIIDNKLRE